MRTNYGMYEGGSGGRIELTNTGIKLTGAIWTMIYTRIMGGNDQSTDSRINQEEFKNDYWGNSLGILKNKKELRINSNLPILLKSISLISSNLTRIERVVLEDIDQLTEIFDFNIEASIPKKDNLKINITAIEKGTKKTSQMQYVIDQTDNEQIINKEPEVFIKKDGLVKFEDDTIALFENDDSVKFEEQ